jgi:Tol biopolymer transport system component
MDAAGKTQTLLTTNGGTTPRVSPDGKVVALAMGGDIMRYDLERRVNTSVTANGLLNHSPIWTPDGKHIIFSQRSNEGAIWWTRSDASAPPQKLFSAPDAVRAQALSPDGRRLAFSRQNAVTGWDIWMLPLDLADPDRPKVGEPEAFLVGPGDQDYPAFSPDGRWVVFSTDDAAGRTELYAQPFPGGSAAHRVQITTEGGKFALWSRNGKDIFYVARDDRVMRMPYTATNTDFRAARPHVWSESPILNTGIYWNFDLASDGRHIITFPAPPSPRAGQNASLHVTFLLNFFDELKRRVP